MSDRGGPARAAAALPMLALSMVLAGCAATPRAPGGFAFAVMGDVPYNAAEEPHFEAMIRRIDREDVAFVVHVGDFLGGRCDDDVYARRRDQFDRSVHPFLFTPGDNEWVDCRAHGHDAPGRLQHLREVFFAGRQSQGVRKLETLPQDQCLEPPVTGCGCGAYPENRRWSVETVSFVTLNIPGSSNNEGFDARSDTEARCRNEANRRWLAAAAESAATASRALVVIVQANPFDTFTERPVYGPFVKQLEDIAQQWRGQVLLIHGDTHVYRADTPFLDSWGEPRVNMRRLETYGSPFVGWAMVRYDPSRPDLFTFEPHLEAIVR